MNILEPLVIHLISRETIIVIEGTDLRCNGRIAVGYAEML